MNWKQRLHEIKVKKIIRLILFISFILHLIAVFLFYKAACWTKTKVLWNLTKKMRDGNLDLVKNKCEFTNCYLVKNINGFDASKFDAVLFDHEVDYLPGNRSAKHKYIFRTLESPINNPVCSEDFDNIFNWTWTYKLDSDFPSTYFTVYDLAGKVVGPAMNLKWPAKFEPINNDIKYKLKGKSLAAAWFVSNCYTSSNREVFVEEVQQELEKFGLTVDIYGHCGPLKCSKRKHVKCLELIEKYYYFYFSLENSLTEDYVTEKVLTALDNYAVPVVFGGADYSRFLPPGSYLDGKKMAAKELAKQMDMIIRNKSKYYDFFRWRNHFIYKKNTYEDDVCRLCAIINDRRMLEKQSTWKNFRIWWNGEDFKEICLENNNY